MGITFVHRAAGAVGFALSSISILSIPDALRAQAVVRGVLYDDVSGSPLRGTVMLVDPSTNATVVYVATDSIGWFDLRAKDGTYRISAVRGGYTSVLSAPIPLRNGELMTVLVPIAVSGDPQHSIGVVQHVRAGAAGSATAANDPQARRATKIGLHYDRAQLEKSNRGTLGDFLQSVPGMTVTNSRSSASIQMSRSVSLGNAGARGQLTECHMGWFVDGQRWDIPGQSDLSVDAIASTPLSGIETLEVFRGLSEMPTDLASPELRCGAVAIWTRRS